MNFVSYEPVIVQALVSVLVWISARYGLGIDEATAGKIAVGFFALASVFVRQLVWPDAKVREQPPVGPAG